MITITISSESPTFNRRLEPSLVSVLLRHYKKFSTLTSREREMFIPLFKEEARVLFAAEFIQNVVSGRNVWEKFTDTGSFLFTAADTAFRMTLYRISEDKANFKSFHRYEDGIHPVESFKDTRYFEF